MSDILADLESLLPDLPAGVAQRRLGHHLNQTLQVLGDIDRQTRRLAGLIACARTTGIDRSSRIADVLDEALDTADDLARRMEAAAGPDDVRAIAELYDRLIRQMTTLERFLRAELKNLLEREFGVLLPIGRIFESIEGTADLGLRLVSCAEAALACADTTAADQLVSIIGQLGAQRADLDRERAAEIRDPDVAAFFDALLEGSASLRLVTPPVRAWLAAHEALDNFKVR